MKIEKLREAKAWAWKRVLVARSCARVGRKGVMEEVKGIDVLVAGSYSYLIDLLLLILLFDHRVSASAPNLHSLHPPIHTTPHRRAA